MFTNGKCFWFAKILEDAFPGGTIYYDAVIGHFYYQYNDLFWDICGKHLILDGDSNLIEWDTLQWEDCLWAKRIKRDCVFFEEVEP